MNFRRWSAALLLALCVADAAAQDSGTWVSLPAATFQSALRFDDAPGRLPVGAFRLMRRPVTNAQFLAFVRAAPRWRRDRVPVSLAEPRYLAHWAGALQLGPGALPDQPVTRVSWFAADAYCQAQGARLPTWAEWEYAAAADETRQDARTDPAWRERILDWYARPSNQPLPAVGLGPANAYGVQDLHGLVWEWADDYSALLVTGDDREQGGADRLRFCGAAALSADDRENFPVLMRAAMLSSLRGADVTANLGFRCARSAP